MLFRFGLVLLILALDLIQYQGKEERHKYTKMLEKQHLLY